MKKQNKQKKNNSSCSSEYFLKIMKFNLGIFLFTVLLGSSSHSASPIYIKYFYFIYIYCSESVTMESNAPMNNQNQVSCLSLDTVFYKEQRNLRPFVIKA